MVSLRIAYFGTPEFAVPTLRELLGSRHTVAGVVTQPDRARGRGQKVTHSPVKTLALEAHLPVFQPDRLRAPDVEETIREWQPDLGVVAAYGKLIPDALLAVPRLGMINVHGSLLPRWRGAAPVHRAVMAGDPETGITIMRVVRELDAGAMFAKVPRAIAPDETSDVVERDLAALGAALLVRVVDQIADGTSLEEPQDERLVTYAAKITKDEGWIDWGLPAGEIHNRVRGLFPWPHASTSINGERLIIWKTSRLAERSGSSPGTIIAVARTGIDVATGGGELLRIEELQAEGRKPMPVRDFLAGRPIAAGARLGA